MIHFKDILAFLSPSWHAGQHLTIAQSGADLAAHTLAHAGMGVSVNNNLAQLFYSLGDSISAYGGRVVTAGVVDANVYRVAWQNFAELGSGGVARWGGTFATQGYFIAQIKNTWLPQLLQFGTKGSAVFLLAGQNDLSAGQINAQAMIDYESIVTQLIYGGFTPIMCTLTPYNSSYSLIMMNRFIMGLAEKYRLQVADFNGALINPSTGGWTAGYTADNIHPNEAGCVVMGAVAASALQKIFPRPFVSSWLAKTSVGYGPNRSTQTGGTTNPLFDTSAGSGTDVPSGWFIGTGAGACTYASTSYGRACSFNGSGAPNTVFRNNSNTTAVPGDKLRCTGIMTVNIGANGSVAYGLLNGSGVQLYDRGRNNNSLITANIARSPFCFDVVHSGTAGLFFDLSVVGTGTSIVLEQFSVVNLTSMGLT